MPAQLDRHIVAAYTLQCKVCGVGTRLEPLSEAVNSCSGGLCPPQRIVVRWAQPTPQKVAFNTVIKEFTASPQIGDRREVKDGRLPGTPGGRG